MGDGRTRHELVGDGVVRRRVLFGRIRRRRPAVHSAPEGAVVEPELQQRVDVARRAEVRQAGVRPFLAGHVALYQPSPSKF